MDLEDVSPTFQVGQAKLDLPVQSAWPQQRRVQRVWAVGRHQHLHVPSRVEAIELVDDLQHGALHLVVAVRVISSSGATDSIDLIDEENASLLRACQLEELSHHSRTLTHVALHELGTDDADETCVSAVGDRAGRQRLPRAGRAVQQDTLGRVDTQCHEAFGLQQGHLDDLAQSFQLLLGTANVVVGHVWLLLDRHHRHTGVYLWRKRDLDAILAAVGGVDADAHALLNVSC
mmetsp:Transcript_104646/g.234966  ORF Transcript_104646/g.234966 Transcript_104646/m.234966 type:complete len:232 (+) Transcript_104646:453-1148(+)